MTFQEKTSRTIERTKQVFHDCALENGAIVAANTDKSYVPREAADYRAVWPRDASYVCAAAGTLKIPVQEKFFDWLQNRPQDLRRDHLIYQKYSTHGRKLGGQFQADQAGTVLWAIFEHFKNEPLKALRYSDLINWLANGLCRVWEKTHFNLHVTDLWEEEHRHTSVTMQNNFTYSLAACARGLLCAQKLIANPLWEETACQMKSKIQQAWSAEDGYFLRNHGRVSDRNIDASLLGLVWPFNIIEAKDPRILAMVSKIEENLVIKGGVYRYQFDYFDGEGSAQEGAGAWPLLNFWMSIYFSLAGNREKALNYYQWVIDRLEKYDYYIPEQIFDDFRVGIYPLAWAHALFVCASRQLGLL